MLKTLFWLLLIVNGGLFALHRGYLGSLIADGREPQRVANQLHADRVQLVSASAANGLATPASAPAPQEGPHAAAQPSLIACTEIGNFAPAEAKRFEERLAELALGDRQARHNVKEVTSHMVYIPPQGDQEAADRKASELKRRGLTNYFIIQDNSNLRWGISLGVFKTEEAARNQLADLNRQGVHSARIGARSITGSKMAFQLHNLDAATKTRLDSIKTGFPAQDMHPCS
jgi:hypothetical protein